MPRKKGNSNWFPSQQQAHEYAPAIGVPRRCGFCAINLVNIPCDEVLGVELVLDPGANRNPRTAKLFSREYCSEYCVIQDAIALFSPAHKAAYIARAKQNRPQWLAETFDSISVGRGSRIGQVAPPNYTRSSSGHKCSRVDTSAESMQL